MAKQTISELITDAKIRLDLTSFSSRHPDSEWLSEFVASYERLRELVSVYSDRYYDWITPRYNTSSLETDFKVSKFILADANNKRQYTGSHPKIVMVKSAGKWFELNRKTVSEIITTASNSMNSSYPTGWAFLGQDSQYDGIESLTALDPGTDYTYGNDCIIINAVGLALGDVKVYCLPYLDYTQYQTQTMINLESIGKDWIIYDIGEKMAGKDNQLNERAQLWGQKKAEAIDLIKKSLEKDKVSNIARQSVKNNSPYLGMRRY